MDLHAALDHESDVLDLAPLTGVDDAWMWTGPNDRFRHAAALAADGKHSFEIRTMDSWNEEIARAVLAFAVVHSEEFLGSDSLTTPVAGFTSPVRSFDTVASISPRVTRYQHDAPELTDATVPVFPAWHFEFSENATDSRRRNSSAHRCHSIASASPTPRCGPVRRATACTSPTGMCSRST
jgi:hypothetical protein